MVLSRKHTTFLYHYISFVFFGKLILFVFIDNINYHYCSGGRRQASVGFFFGSFFDYSSGMRVFFVVNTHTNTKLKDNKLEITMPPIILQSSKRMSWAAHRFGLGGIF